MYRLTQVDFLLAKEVRGNDNLELTYQQDEIHARYNESDPVNIVYLGLVLCGKCIDSINDTPDNR